MSFKSQIQDRMQRLQEIGAALPEKIQEAQTIAAEWAVKVASDATPPNADSEISGTKTRSGSLKARWAEDSQTESERRGDDYVVALANNAHYAGYVNDGHRVDKHFVPGLMLNPDSGMLEKVPPEMGGIIVGTKTTYVPGLYMKEKAAEEYEKQLAAQLGRMLDDVK